VQLGGKVHGRPWVQKTPQIPGPYPEVIADFGQVKFSQAPW
jgi:hypothetical protein